MGEEIGTKSTARCGGYKWGKCPQSGHNLSFREEQEVHMGRTNLQYDEESRHWITSYPRLVDPETLPDNFTSSLATLWSTEKSLARDPKRALSYSDQMQEMVDREAVRKLTCEEVEQHCHHFLWRDQDSCRKPDTYIMQRVNMGDHPPAAIVTEALFMTADLAQERLPKAACLIKSSNYMDELITSVVDKQAALVLTNEMDTVLRYGGFEIKCWQLTGETERIHAAVERRLPH